jgi:enoyl-CoA hydratase
MADPAPVAPVAPVPTSDIVKVEIVEGVAVVHIDDGKRNALSHAVLELLGEALDRAEADDVRAVCFVGRPGTLSAGFDLKVMMAGPDQARELVEVGARFLMRLYGFPKPTVVAVTGHALAAGALLALACDTRIGADVVDVKIGLNEVAIGMRLPVFGVELARDRLGIAVTRAVVQAELVGPAAAIEFGYLDTVVPVADCEGMARAEARRLSQLGAGYGITKRSLRGEMIARVLAGLTADLSELGGPSS